MLAPFWEYVGNVTYLLENSSSPGNGSCWTEGLISNTSGLRADALCTKLMASFQGLMTNRPNRSLPSFRIACRECSPCGRQDGPEQEGVRRQQPTFSVTPTDYKRSNKSAYIESVLWPLDALVSLEFVYFIKPNIKETFSLQASILVTNKLDTTGVEPLCLEYRV